MEAVLKRVDQLEVRIYADRPTLAREAALLARDHLVNVLHERGTASVMLATGNSQIQFLSELTRLGSVDWSKIVLFHMDEYLGISSDHPASFRRYMRERVESRLRPRFFYYIEGDALEPMDECDRYSALLREHPLDLCCLGIGENGHLAFNDPPVARFDDPRLVKIVKLDAACGQQQVDEGHFPNLAAVPEYALTVTIPALCQARRIICLAPEQRKAEAVRNALEGPLSPRCPASILRRQPQATLFLDRCSSALLKAP